MSLPHHGNPNDSPERLFLNQLLGDSTRSYPAGRMGAEDDGQLAFAITLDKRYQKIVIRFPKAVEWVGLGRKEAEELRDYLTEKLLEMRGIAAS